MKSQMPVVSEPLYPKYAREPIPEVIPASMARAAANSHQDANLLAVQQRQQPQTAHFQTAAHAVGRDLKQLSAVEEKTTRTTVPAANTTFETVTPVEFVNSSQHLNMPNADESPLTQYISYKMNDHPNTAIMTCSNLRQIVPSNAAPLDTKEPLYISLMVPPSPSIKGHTTTIGENSTTFTEITCRVESVKTVTLGVESSTLIATTDV